MTLDLLIIIFHNACLSNVYLIWKCVLSASVKRLGVSRMWDFLLRFENENIYFDIPSYPLPIVVRNSLTNQFYQKNQCFCIFSKKEKRDKFFRDPSLHFSFAPFFWRYTETLIGQWIPDGDGRGIARDIKINYFHVQNLTKKWKQSLNNLKS